PAEVWAEATSPGADTAHVLGRGAPARVRGGIEASLERLGVHFDVWTTERSLHEEGWVARAGERLRERGYVYEQAGAIWSRSPDLGDDKDRVIYRSNGQPTYFAADIGYVTEKFSRGFDHLIYIWGADHHSTAPRVRNAAKAMGYDVEAVQMLLYSWVRFVRDGVEILMSERAGEFITLDDLFAAVRRDAGSGAANSSRSPSCWPKGPPTQPAGSSRRAPRPHRSTSTSSWPRSSRTRTRSTTSNTPMRRSRASCGSPHM